MPRGNPPRRLLVATLAAALALTACTFGSDRPPAAAPPDPATTVTDRATPEAADRGPITLPVGLRLSKGSPPAPPASPMLVDGDELNQTQLKQVLDRLPEFTDDPDLEESFRRPTRTDPPPAAGTRIDQPIPAPQTDPPTPPTAPNTPVEVLRYQPEGAVAIAPFVGITFNQPMSPIGTVTGLGALEVPARISPELPGRWRWVGTRTLRFDATSAEHDRLPMATTFTVTVPAGTEAPSGGTLAEEVTFSFSTPPPTAIGLTPKGDNLPLIPVFVAAFDQNIDQADVLEHLTLVADGQNRPIRLATAAEVAADEVARRAVADLVQGRYVAFRPVTELPTDSTLRVTVGAGTPSAEGPMVTTADQHFSGQTYPPLTITRVDCDFQSCTQQFDMFHVRLSNELDAELFDPSSVVVSPAIEDLNVAVYGSIVAISGNIQPRTSYRITLAAGLTDIHGQQLGVAPAREVTTGAAHPYLQAWNSITTLDAHADRPELAVKTTNWPEFRIRLYAVTPDDLPDYLSWMSDRNWHRADVPETLSGEPVMDEVITVNGPADALTTTPVPMDEVLAEVDGRRRGHLLAVVEASTEALTVATKQWSAPVTITWVQATDLGLDALTDGQELQIWATDLRSGDPIPGVSVLAPESAPDTDELGLSTVSLTGSVKAVIAGTATDSAILLPDNSFWSEWRRQAPTDDARWYVHDDRGTYRPGETVHLRGWVRTLTHSTDGQLTGVKNGASVTYVVRDQNGTTIADGTTALSATGGFEVELALPDGVSLGRAWAELSLTGAGVTGTRTHEFTVADFRRPDFEVSTHAATSGPHVLGEDLTVTAESRYYAGGPLSEAQVEWQVETGKAEYTPPGWDRYTFGIWTPWWHDSGYGRGLNHLWAVDTCYPCGGPDPEGEVEIFSGTTDDEGRDHLQIQVGDLGAELAGLPVAVIAQAAVTDINRQVITDRTEFVVHPADHYIGLAGPATFVSSGSDLEIDVVVTDVDGRPVADREVTLIFGRIVESWSGGTTTQTTVDPVICTATTAGTGTARCVFRSTTGGSHRITGTVVDDRGRIARSELTRWVAGTSAQESLTVGDQGLTLVPDKPEYEPGTTAQVLVGVPFDSGTGLLSISRNGLMGSSTFEVAGGFAVLDIPIDETAVPNLDLSVEVVGHTPREDGSARTAYATGTLQLAVSVAWRRLTVTATPEASSVGPGDDTSVTVSITDHTGAPVGGSEFELIVVDEAVLAVGGYELADPMEAFYSPVSQGLYGTNGRAATMLTGVRQRAELSAGMPYPASASEEAVFSTSGGNLAFAFDMAASGGPIELRQNFDAVAVYRPSVTTDSTGRARVEVALPDSLTRYRVMVVAVAGALQFGTGEATITAQLPLSVRPTAPRFANFGDTFELPVLVQNLGTEPLSVDVVLQTANLDLTGPHGKRVQVPAGDRVEVRFPVAARKAGTARFRVAAIGGEHADATQVELPVYTPTTTETVADYGVVDSGGVITQPMLAPQDVYPEFGGLQIRTSTTLLSELTDALLYLEQYEYESVDAFAGQILAITSLDDVLAALTPDPADPERIRATIDTTLDRMVALQRTDGGFGLWHPNESEPHPFPSILAAHALVQAQAAGHPVDPTAIDSALEYLTTIESHLPAGFGQADRDTLTAYALYVRHLAGADVTVKAADLVDARGDRLPLDAAAWLWSVLGDDPAAAQIADRVNRSAVDTAGSVTFTTSVSDTAWVTLSSDRRTDALVLDALIRTAPDSDLIPKVVSGLMQHRINGRWRNLQENTFVLLAMRNYFDTFEATDPDLTARVWLGERYAGEHTFVGHSTDNSVIDVPMSALLETTDPAITLQADGTGRMYYRVGLTSAPTITDLEPVDRGFVVSRSYEAIDDPADVVRGTDGTWTIRAGARVRITVELVAESTRHHVALIDPLPAGLEIRNPDLVITDSDLAEAAPPTGGYHRGWFTSSWYGTWFDHQNLRDDRAEAAVSWLEAGVYSYSYTARATTPGAFVVPPPRAEEVHTPETFGRGATDRVVVLTR